MKSPPVSWPKSKNWIFLWDNYEQKTGRRKILLSKLKNFSLFSFQFSFSLVWKVTLIFILTLAKSDTQPEPIHACIFDFNFRRKSQISHRKILYLWKLNIWKFEWTRLKILYSWYALDIEGNQTLIPASLVERITNSYKSLA